MARTTPKGTVHFHSLGCPKNRLDTELMLGALAMQGYALAERIEDADVAVVNTCAFIESAREESIHAILEVSDLRQGGRLRALVVTGCLPQRYGQDLARELPEVDAFVGTADFPDLPRILDAALEGLGRGVYVEPGRTYLYSHQDPRVLIGPTHSAYVKIAEGCDRVCAFCAIPSIRGRFQSRGLASVVAEARQLARLGVREVNLVAQDSTSWGKDLPGRPRLPELLRALDELDELEWIRLLYAYPTAVSDELIETLARGRRLLPYIDVPLQHASDRILKAMRRGASETLQRRMVERLRAGIPELTLRTTFVVGFPGETEADFEHLCQFVRELRFDRVGVFRYSDEEGTAAFEVGEKVPRPLARARQRRLLEIQCGIVAQKLAAEVGQERLVLVDRGGNQQAVGRLGSQAPEIDGSVLLRGQAPTGAFVRARMTGVRGVDLEAEILPDRARACG